MVSPTYSLTCIRKRNGILQRDRSVEKEVGNSRSNQEVKKVGHIANEHPASSTAFLGGFIEHLINHTRENNTYAG